MAQPATMEAPVGMNVVMEESLPAYQAYQILHWMFCIGLLVAGIDTFLHLLTDWNRYLAPEVPQMLHLTVHNAMAIVGVVDIVLALLVAIKPRIWAPFVVLWFAIGIANLIALQSFYDVALRDLGLLMAAIALSRLSVSHERTKKVRTNI
jgi:hypothetical protein